MFIITECGIPRVADNLTSHHLNRLAAIEATWLECKAFDEVSCYEARPTRLPTFSTLQRFLAYTVYNPPMEIEVKWQVAGPCVLADILTEVQRGLEKDDDIIQQWFDADKVMKLLQSARSFDEMVDRVRCICGEFEVDPRLRHIVDSVL